MKNLAPKILRQRLLVEGFYTIEVNEQIIEMFFSEILEKLKLRAYGKPTIYATGSQGKEINQGYDAFIPLIDSGISIYVWGSSKFLSIIFYTCKQFDEKAAMKFVKDFFRMEKIESMSF